jgi:hypothetical protein
MERDFVAEATGQKTDPDRHLDKPSWRRRAGGMMGTVMEPIKGTLNQPLWQRPLSC